MTSVVYAHAINRRPVPDNFPIELMQQTEANLLLACKLICLAFNSADLSRSPLMCCMCYLSFRAVVHVKFSALLCRTIVPVIFVFSFSLFQGPLYIVQCSSKCCFVLLLPSNQSCSCYLRILLFRLFFNLLYCIYVVFFLYSRDVAFVLSFYQATILSNVAFGFFSFYSSDRS